MRTFLIIGFLLASGIPSFAAEVPDYPIEQWCETVSQTVGGSDRILNSCMGQEEAAATTLAGMPPIPAQIAGWCHDFATVDTWSAGSIQLYLWCVTTKLQAASR